MEKILSDGTIARPGTIVVVLTGIHCGFRRNTVVQIKFVSRKNAQNSKNCCMDLSVQRYTVLCNIGHKCWFERVFDLRKATPAERKLYRRKLSVYKSKIINYKP